MTDQSKTTASSLGPSWEGLRQAMVRAVDLIDAGASSGEVKAALLQPFEQLALDELTRRKAATDV